MSYPKQKTWLKKMEKQTVVQSRIDEERAVARVRTMWEATKYTMKARIREEYRKTFPKGLWDLSRARQHGTLLRIQRHTSDSLNSFGACAAPFIADTLNKAKKERVLRLAWMLDQTSPPNVRPKIGGQRLRMKEAAVSGSIHIYSGPEAEATWVERFGEWMKAYDETLNRNITLGALNNSDPDEAAQEVETARTGNRSNDFWNKIDSIFRTEHQRAETEGAISFMDDNEDMMMSEIWQAMADSAVCPECEAMDGLTREQATEEIPLHPNCRCYWRIVPRAYADFMNSLDPAAARSIADAGIAPDAMVLRDPESGKIAGMAWIEFKDWKGNIVGAR